MALVVADRVQETTTTTGTGTYTLAGAKDGFQSFAAVGNGNTTYYACTDGTDYEVGIGTYTASGTTLARTTIIESSNSDAAVNWGAGSKDIFVTAPADKTLLVGRNLYADNPSSPTAPSATGTNGIAIGDGAQALNFDDALAIGASSLANNTQTQAVGRDTSATGSRSSAFGRSATASNSWSTAVGYGPTASGTSSLALGRSATAAGDYSTAITNSYASGAAAFAAAIANSTSSYGATGANSIAIGELAKSTGTTNGSVAIGHEAQATSRETVAIGSSALASGSGGVALGGYFGVSNQARATGTSSFVVSGYNGLFNRDTTASGLGSVALSGGEASQTQSIALGMSSATIKGKLTKGAFPFGTDVGTTQYGLLVLQNQTTDATAAVLVSDTDYTSPSTDNQVILPNNSAYAFHGTIVAREDASDGTDCAAWKIEGLIRREANAGTTVLVNSATTVLDNTPSWGMALSADTTNGGLAITVTGAAATNIRWVATIHTSEVTYA